MSPEIHHSPQQSNKSDQFSVYSEEERYNDQLETEMYDKIMEFAPTNKERANIERLRKIMFAYYESSRHGKEPIEPTLGPDDALAIIRNFDDETILDFIHSLGAFQDLDYADIANKLINSSKGDLLGAYVKACPVVLDNSKLVNKLIHIEHRNREINNTIYRFPGLSHIDIANRLIKAAEASEVEPADDLNEFQDLDQDLADKLIKAGHGIFVLMHFDEFQNIDCIDTVKKLILAKCESYIPEYIDIIPDSYHVDIAKMLIDTGSGDRVGDRLEDFKNLDVSVAYKFVEAKKGGWVIIYINRFPDLNYADFVDKMIKNGQGSKIVKTLDRDPEFNDLDRTNMANQLIENNQIVDVISRLDEEFKNVNRAVIVNTLIDNNQVPWVIRCLREEFKDVSRANIVKKLIETGNGHYIIENSYEFPGIKKELLDQLRADNQ